MSDILDSYCEKAAFGKRVIELYDDRVVVAGHRILGGGDFKLVIPLSTLDPTISQLGIHQQTRLIGVAVFLCAGIGALSWAVRPPVFAHIGFWVCSLLAVFGFVLLVQSFRRIETAAFYSTAGVLRLTVARVGPHTGRYQDFVERISSQIALCGSAEGRAI
jgi:hypothetical protein